MDTTADNLLNQIGQVFLNKLDKTDLDPNFLKSFLDSCCKKITAKDNRPISQEPPTKKDPQKSTALEYAEGQKLLLRGDNQYVRLYQEFLKKVYTKPILDLFHPQQKQTSTRDIVSQTKEQKTNIFAKLETLLSVFVQEQQKQKVKNNVFKSESETPKFIKEAEKPKEIIIGGFTQIGLRSLRDSLGGVFSSVLDKFQKKLEKLLQPSVGKGIGLLGAGLILLLGGLAALVAGIMTDGPFKGLLKILSKVGIGGGLRLLEFGAKMFMSSLKLVLEAPIRLLRTVGEALKGVFGPETAKALIRPISKIKGIFTTILKGIGRMLGFAVRRIPLIGSIISLGFAVSRFIKGDIVGGVIDTLSALAGLLYLTPAAPLAFPIILGLDILNMILDFKGDGSKPGATGKKLGVIWGWIKGIGGLILKGLKNLPIIGPAIKAVEEFTAGNYLKGLKQLAYIATPLEFIGALLGDKEASGVTKAVATPFRMVWQLVSWIGKALYHGLKSLPIIGPAIKAVEEFTSGNFLKGIKQLAYIFTPFEFIGALLGDTEASGLTKATTSAFKGIGSVIKKFGSWLAKTLWKVFSNIPIVGPLLKGVKELFSGNFGKAIKQFLYINPVFELIGALLGDQETGAVAQTGASAIKSIGSMLKDFGKWVFSKIHKLPVIGPLIKSINEFSKGNYLKGLKQLAYINPVFEAIGGLLGDTEAESLAGDLGRGIKDIVKGLWDWIKNTLWEKVTGFITGLVDGIKNWWNNLSWNPSTWFGAGDEPTMPEPIQAPVKQKSVFQPIQTQINTNTLNKTEEAKQSVQNTLHTPATLQEQKNDTSTNVLKTDIHNIQNTTEKNNTAYIEKEPSAPIPINDYLDPKTFNLNNESLADIVKNTKETNASIQTLGEIFARLVGTFDKKLSTSGGTTIIANGRTVRQDSTPASLIANTNDDPIRRVRMKFA
jgi:hypothetical protein